MQCIHLSISSDTIVTVIISLRIQTFVNDSSISETIKWCPFILMCCIVMELFYFRLDRICQLSSLDRMKRSSEVSLLWVEGGATYNSFFHAGWPLFRCPRAEGSLLKKKKQHNQLLSFPETRDGIKANRDCYLSRRLLHLRRSNLCSRNCGNSWTRRGNVPFNSMRDPFKGGNNALWKTAIVEQLLFYWTRFEQVWTVNTGWPLHKWRSGPVSERTCTRSNEGKQELHKRNR